MKKRAAQQAESFRVPYVERGKQSVAKLAAFYECPVLLVTEERMELYDLSGRSPFFFHPGSAMFRVKRLMNDEPDAFVEACGLEPGMSFLDCTMGPAVDSMTASYAVGVKGRVESIEASEAVARIVEEGLGKWTEGPADLIEAMRRIHVKTADYHTYLQTVPDDSFDVVYFDPMFEETIDSDGIAPLRSFASYADLTMDAVNEAKRIARKRVVLKDHFRSQRFAAFGFQQHIRKTAKFHFGTIESGDFF
ncbi:class I SAM-dependent methyltransferase [Domibacillus antri]|uniref:class I SAM-dependent methyltransferase n=1 Tax=Domibacillus antri TaxID=1714264 RepID=UPI001FE65C23|nr:class I SAM-dependent methyltransferase [Domibacillus antri]